MQKSLRPRPLTPFIVADHLPATAAALAVARAAKSAAEARRALPAAPAAAAPERLSGDCPPGWLVRASAPGPALAAGRPLSAHDGAVVIGASASVKAAA